MEVCLFHHIDKKLIEIMINGISVKSKHSMTVLGIIFNSKLARGEHVSRLSNKTNIKQIKYYFTTEEIRSANNHIKLPFDPVLHLGNL